jgi:hypothetical protein
MFIWDPRAATLKGGGCDTHGGRILIPNGMRQSGNPETIVPGNQTAQDAS